MSYTKTNWQNDQAPAINATNLNKIETGIFDNDAMLTSILNTLGINTTTWVSTNTYVEGQSVVYNNKIYKNITGNYTATNPASDTTNWQETTMLDIQYPVGKTELFFDTLDHSKHLGFTWERTSVGRAIVGYDSTQTEFDTIGETGGSKELQSHTHNVAVAWGQSGADLPNTYYPISQSGPVYAKYMGNGGSGGNFLTSAGTGNSGNLQPYQVFSIWKRVS